MPHPTSFPTSSRLIVWSRIALIIATALLLAGVSTKFLLTGGTPFGWSGHWTLDVDYGTALRSLAALLWVPAFASRLDRRVLVATVVLAFAIPPTDHTFSFINAMILLVLPLWIIDRTLNQLQPRGRREQAVPSA